MTPSQEHIVAILDHPRFTVEYMREWTARNDDVMINAPAALQAMEAKGYLEAVRIFEKIYEKALPKMA